MMYYTQTLGECFNFLGAMPKIPKWGNKSRFKIHRPICIHLKLDKYLGNCRPWHGKHPNRSRKMLRKMDLLGKFSLMSSHEFMALIYIAIYLPSSTSGTKLYFYHRALKHKRSGLQKFHFRLQDTRQFSDQVDCHTPLEISQLLYPQ